MVPKLAANKFLKNKSDHNANLLIATTKCRSHSLCCQSFYPHSGPMKGLLCLQFSDEGAHSRERLNNAPSHTTGEFGRAQSEPRWTFFGVLLSSDVWPQLCCGEYDFQSYVSASEVLRGQHVKCCRNKVSLLSYLLNLILIKHCEQGIREMGAIWK